MTQFTRHVIHRATIMPSSLNYYHGMLPKKKYEIFKPRSLFNGPDINATRLAAIASEFGADAESLRKDAQAFLDHVPAKTPVGKTVKLHGRPPDTPFMDFLRKAIKAHPPDVMNSLRKGQSQFTAASFFFAHWVSQFAIKPYFDVSSLPLSCAENS